MKIMLLYVFSIIIIIIIKAGLTVSYVPVTG